MRWSRNVRGNERAPPPFRYQFCRADKITAAGRSLGDKGCAKSLTIQASNVPVEHVKKYVVRGKTARLAGIYSTLAPLPRADWLPFGHTVAVGGL